MEGDEREEAGLLDVYRVEGDSKNSLYGYHLYFEKSDKSSERLIMEKVRAGVGFFTRSPDIATIIPSKAGPAFSIDINRFYSDREFMNEWINFESDIKNRPRDTLNCLGLALHQIIVESNLRRHKDLSLPMIRVKVTNYKPLVALRDIKVGSYGKLIGTRGCVIRVGPAKYTIHWLPFTCNRCSSWMVLHQPDGLQRSPKKCKSCGGGKFTPRWESPHVKALPFRVIKLQEHFDNKQDDRGRMPRIVEIELIDDLVESCLPGDDITIVGIIKVRGTDDGGESRRQVSPAAALYMEAISVINNKNRCRNRNDELDHQDYIAIKKIHDAQNVFSQLVNSVCPAIYGHEMIKAGLLLSLFGGCVKHDSLRDDLHVLLIGDPGLGKSQLLQACSRVTSKGVYVCGNSSTTSGLTVTLTRENGRNDFALEPGALVLADRGTCFIDEFDKMPTQHQALLEAMEQSRVSVAKSGIICSLPARTSIVAAANPIGGKYDPSKSFMKNLNLSEPLLSRFDMIFLFLDSPSEQLDTLMCSHVMNAHVGLKKAASSGDSSNPVPDCSAGLRERLTQKFGRDDLISQSILRKYISYAKLYVKPRLTPAAAEVLRNYYLELRQRSSIFGQLPVFHRQLEALIRLTEARAKVELRTEATEADAGDVIEIYEYGLSSVPEVGGFTPALGRDSGKITGNKVAAFISLLSQAAEEGNQRVFSAGQLMKLALDGGIVVNEFSRFIRRLNNEGILIKQAGGLYKFVNL